MLPALCAWYRLVNRAGKPDSTENKQPLLPRPWPGNPMQRPPPPPPEFQAVGRLPGLESPQGREFHTRAWPGRCVLKTLPTRVYISQIPTPVQPLAIATQDKKANCSLSLESPSMSNPCVEDLSNLSHSPLVKCDPESSGLQWGPQLRICNQLSGEGRAAGLGVAGAGGP